MAAANETPLVYTTLESVHEAAEGRDLLGINDGVFRSCKGGQAEDRFSGPSRTQTICPKPLTQIFIHRKDAAHFSKWSWGNQLLVILRGFTDARGFQQWNAVGRFI